MRVIGDFISSVTDVRGHGMDDRNVVNSTHILTKHYFVSGQVSCYYDTDSFIAWSRVAAAG